ncbi:MAG: metallophosphoesterase [Patescibacteria group bacterium]
MKRKTVGKIIVLMLIILFGLVGVAQAYDLNAFDFVVYGDSHAGYEPAVPIHEAILAEIETIEPDLILHTGDYTHGDDPTTCAIFEEVTQRVRSNYPYYLTTGNHDEDKVCAVDSYHFNFKDALFVSLKVPKFTDKLSVERFNWLKSLIKNSAKRFKFVFFHNPPYSTGIRGCNTTIREQISDLLDNYRVDVVFNGHAHGYERFTVGNVKYVVTGGGGGVPHDLGTINCTNPINSLQYSEETYNYVKVQVKTNSLTLEAYNTDGEMIDTMSIVKPPVKKKILASAIEKPLTIFKRGLTKIKDIMGF